MKKLLFILQDILFIAVITFLCVMIYTYHKTNTVSVMNYKFLRIISNSMEPTLHPNTCIVIKVVENEDDLEIGDIITFISHEESIYGEINTHRIYDIIINEETGRKEFVTKGDYFDEPDITKVSFSNVKGRYVRKIPLSGLLSFILIRLSNSKIYFIIIIFPLILCLLTYINQLVNILVFGVDYKKVKKKIKLEKQRLKEQREKAILEQKKKE